MIIKRIKLLLYLALVLVLFSACTANYTQMKVDGTGMNPTLKDRDEVLVTDNVGNIKRGDIILLKHPKDRSKVYFKRVIGLPNEGVYVYRAKVVINNKELDEPYLDKTYNRSTDNYPWVKVPNTGYYVVGDNRDNSNDSRYYGPVDKDLILGKYYSASE